MKHLKPLNKKAKKIETGGTKKDVTGYACSDCGTSFAPGWETGACGNIDPCPWAADLPACYWASCWWSGASVPGINQYPTWMNCCNNVWQDWQCLCVVPD